MNRRSFVRLSGLGVASLPTLQNALAGQISRTSAISPAGSFTLPSALVAGQRLQSVTSGNGALYTITCDKMAQATTFTSLSREGRVIWSWAPPPGRYVSLRLLKSESHLLALRDLSPPRGGHGLTLAELDFDGKIVTEAPIPRDILDWDLAGGDILTYSSGSIMSVRARTALSVPTHRMTAFPKEVRFASLLVLSETEAAVLDRETAQFAVLDIGSGRNTPAQIGAPEIKTALARNASELAQLENTPTPPGMKATPGRPTVVIAAVADRSTRTAFAMLSPVPASLVATVAKFSMDGTVISSLPLALPQRPDSKFKIPTQMALVSDHLALVYSDGYVSFYQA